MPDHLQLNLVITEKVAVVAPIISVRQLLDESGETIWEPVYKPEATQVQKDLAQTVIDNFDNDVENTKLEADDARAKRVTTIRLADLLISKGIITEEELGG